MPVMAAAITQAPGQVPIYEPLQPAPVGVKPNVEQNVQAGSAEPYWADKKKEQENGSLENNSVQNPSEEYVYSTSTSAQKSSLGLKVLLSLLVLTVIIVGYRFYRTSKKHV